MGSISTLDFIGANTSAAAAELANETVIETAHGVVWPSAPQCVHGAIFDLDGTLLDSMPWWDDLGERYLRSLGKTPERLLHGRFAKKTACPSPLCWKRNTAFLPIADLRDSSKKSPCRKRWITGRSIRTSCATSLTVHSSWSMMNSTSNWLSEIRRRRAFSICSSAAADWRKNIGSSRKISRPSLNGTRRERSARWARRSAKSPRKY